MTTRAGSLASYSHSPMFAHVARGSMRNVEEDVARPASGPPRSAAANITEEGSVPVHLEPSVPAALRVVATTATGGADVRATVDAPLV